MRSAARLAAGLFLLSDPAHAQTVRRDKERNGRDPCGGVGDADPREPPEPDEQQGGDDAPRELRDSGKGGNEAPADPLQRVAVDVDRAEEDIKRTLPEQILPAVGDDL